MKQKAGHNALHVRVAHIKESGEPFHVELEEGALARILEQSDAGYRSPDGAVIADLELQRTGDNVFIHGTIRLSVAAVCSRCLADLTRDMEISIDWTFLPAAQYRAAATEDSEVELTGDDLDVSFYDGEEIDIGRVIEEAILLELEPYPVCVDGCAEDADERPADEAAEIDLRWLPLLELKRKQQS